MTAPPAMVHRIFLAPLRADRDFGVGHEHWTGTHGDVFAKSPGLLGYIQNRPPEKYWPGRTHVCAEVWFADREAETAAWNTDYYLNVVVEDEFRFVQRDGAWLSGVDAQRHATRTLTYRVLAFGHTEQSAAGVLAGWDPDAVDVFALRRPLPTNGHPGALGLWTDDLDQAVDAVAHFGPLSFLAQPKAFVVPPEAPWTVA